MINCLRYPIRERFLSKAALALDLFLWLWWLPVMLGIYTVPVLLKRLSGGTKYKSKPVMELEEAIRIVTLVCALKPFRSRIFPKLCLRQSLALYRALTRMGYPVVIHFGVMKDEKSLHAHSWVTIEGNPVADTVRGGLFKAVYSHSSIYSPLAASDGRKIETSKNVAVLNGG